MKKRLPIIAVFVCAIAVVLVLLFMPEAEKAADRDNDGFPDEIDRCPNKPSKSNNGCPEEELPPAQNKDDKDGDGVLLTDLKRKGDANDADPCVPNENCPICDFDKDGLTLKEEGLKKTDPKKRDTDGDGINDNLDACGTEYGHKDNNGCKVVLSYNFKAGKQTVEWNDDINNYALNIILRVDDQEYPVLGMSSFNGKNIREDVKKSGNGPYHNSDVSLIVYLKDAKSTVINGKNSSKVIFY